MIILLVFVMTTEAAYHKFSWFFDSARIVAPLSMGWQQSAHHTLPHAVINTLLFVGERITKVMNQPSRF